MSITPVGYTSPMSSFSPWLVLPIVFISMAIHELMHALTSYYLGDDTAYLQGRITLNPLKSIDPIYTLAVPFLLALSGSSYIFGAAKPVQVNFSRLRYGEFGGAMVAAAGPLANLVLAVLAAFAFRHINGGGEWLYKVLFTTVAVNVGFFIFNLIPWPPLDGSRILYAFAPEPLQEAMARIERAGLNGLLISLVVFYLLFGTILGNLIQRVTAHLVGLPML